MIETTTLDGIATVRFDDGKVNVLDLATVTELAATLEERSRDARAIVLQGATRAFSAGVDLAGLLQADLAHTEAFLADLDAFVVAVHRIEIPVIAALTGHAIAGGCLLAAACDWRVMGQGRIGVTESLVGLPLPAGALEVLRARTGIHTAGLVTTGRTVGPEEALTLGLVDEVVPPEQVVGRAHEVARTFAATPASTFRTHKRLLRAETNRRIDAARAEFDDEVRAVWLSPAPRAHAAAYLASLRRS